MVAAAPRPDQKRESNYRTAVTRSEFNRSEFKL